MSYFRSILVGLVAMLIAAWIEVIGTIVWAAYSMRRRDLPPGTDVGWDLVTMYRHSPHKLAYWAISVAGFAVGFLLAYRSFSRRAYAGSSAVR